MGVMVRGKDDDHIDEVIQSAAIILSKHQFKIIDPDYDLFRQDRYMRFIPCGYDPKLAQLEMRTRKVYTNHLSALAPIFGRGVAPATPVWLYLIAAQSPLPSIPYTQATALKTPIYFYLAPPAPVNPQPWCIYRC